MINAIVTDSETGKTAKISEEGVLNVVVHPHPPINESITGLPYSVFLTDSNGSNDMIVDGSSTNIEFSARALTEYDFYIKTVTIQISDPSARLDRFGALTALTNGCEFFYESNGTGKLVINEAIKTNLDFFRDATEGKGFTTGSSAWLADIQGGGGEDTYFPELDFSKRFGLLYGLRLRNNSEDKLTITIKDNLAGLSVYNVKVYGLIL